LPARQQTINSARWQGEAGAKAWPPLAKKRFILRPPATCYDTTGGQVLRILGLWTEPEDVDAFERDYLGSHFPRLDELAASHGTKTSRCIDGPYFRMTEISFRTLDEIRAALDAPTGKEVLAAANALADKYGIRVDVLVVAEAT
jgi:hypothetical protein